MGLLTSMLHFYYSHCSFSIFTVQKQHTLKKHIQPTGSTLKVSEFFQGCRVGEVLEMEENERKESVINRWEGM